MSEQLVISEYIVKNCSNNSKQLIVGSESEGPVRDAVCLKPGEGLFPVVRQEIQIRMPLLGSKSTIVSVAVMQKVVKIAVYIEIDRLIGTFILKVAQESSLRK